MCFALHAALTQIDTPLDRACLLIHPLDLFFFIRLQYKNGNDKYAANSQGEDGKQLELMVTILRNQLISAEDQIKKLSIANRTIESTNGNLMTIVDKLKLELTHSETLRKLNEEHTAKLEADLETYKKWLLEKETEVSSLRLTMAKIVRATGHVISPNELALLQGRTYLSDFMKNVSLQMVMIRNNLEPLQRMNGREALGDSMTRSLTNKPSAIYSEPCSRRDSYSSNYRQASPNITRRDFHSVQPSPSTTPPIHTMSASTNQNGDSQAILRSSSAENMKMISELGSPVTFANENKFKRNGKHLYSTLPRNAKAFVQIRKNHENDQPVSVDVNSSSNPPEENRQFNLPTQPVLLSNRLSVKQKADGITFGKKRFRLLRSKRTASAPELGYNQFDPVLLD